MTLGDLEHTLRFVDYSHAKEAHFEARYLYRNNITRVTGEKDCVVVCCVV